MKKRIKMAKKDHPLMNYLHKETDIGMDNMHNKLIKEGYEHFGQLEGSTQEEFRKGLLGLLIGIKELKLEDIRIIPTYLSYLSRYNAKNNLQPEEIGSHSKGSGLHIVYIKRRNNTQA